MMNEQPTRTDVTLAHIFCVLQQFCAVAVYVLGKQIMNEIGVRLFVFLRVLFVIPCVIVGAILVTRDIQAFKITKQQFIPITISGILGIVISQSLLFGGLDKSSPTNASIISAPCTPLFTAFFSVLRGADKMTITKAVGFLSSICGALILLEVENFEFKGTTLGNLLIVGTSICSAANALVQKQALNLGAKPLVVQAYVCTIGAIVYMIVYSPFGILDPSAWQIAPNTWRDITIVGVVASALPWCVGIIALKNTSPMTVSVYVVLQPPVAAFVAVVVMGETLTFRQVLGSLLVLLGLIFVNADPYVNKLIARLKTQIFDIRHHKKQFTLLSNEEGEEKEEEGTEMKELTAEVEDGAGPTTETVIEFNLSTKGETNDFVITDEEEEREEREEDRDEREERAGRRNEERRIEKREGVKVVMVEEIRV